MTLKIYYISKKILRYTFVHDVVGKESIYIYTCCNIWIKRHCSTLLILNMLLNPYLYIKRYYFFYKYNYFYQRAFEPSIFDHTLLQYFVHFENLKID